MRISDWSSDVCSSDLGGKLPAGKSLLVRSSIHKLYFPRRYHRPPHPAQESGPARRLWTNTAKAMRDVPEDFAGPEDFDGNATIEVAAPFSTPESCTAAGEEPGRAACRDRVGQYGSNAV